MNVGATIRTGVYVCALIAAAASARAQEQLCDASRENCRTTLVGLIDNERVGIDVGVWFIKDGRIPAALIRARGRGVPVRMIMDTRATATYPTTGPYLDQLAAAGVQMRRRTAGDICHWKLMIFYGQGVVEWSGANYSPTAFVPNVAYRDYEDEVIFFSHRLVDSFMTVFDDIWTNTIEYANYRNIAGPLVRSHPTTAIDARLNFPPKDSYQNRLVPLIDAEPRTGLIDVDMYRLTMAKPVDALVRAAARGVRQRLYFDPQEYANPARPGNKVQIDRLVAAAAQYPGTIEIRMRAHAGLNHQKTVWLHAQHIVVFGTSNWSDASDDNQLEANIFTDTNLGDPLNDFLFHELGQIFERKFYNDAPDGSIETVAYRTPSLPRPVVSETCGDPTATNVGGPLPCVYPAPPPPPDNATIVISASSADPSAIHGAWQLTADPGAATGQALWNPDGGQAKVATALAAPANYVELTFTAAASTAYHLWIRLRAQGDSLKNDSIHVQFSDSVTSAGAATMRIGSTSSAQVVLQAGDADPSVHGYGWADNGWNAPGANIYFATSGPHTIRIQQREDGAIVDQIVLSSDVYLTTSPGARDDDGTE